MSAPSINASQITGEEFLIWLKRAIWNFEIYFFPDILKINGGELEISNVLLNPANGRITYSVRAVTEDGEVASYKIRGAVIAFCDHESGAVLELKRHMRMVRK